MRNVLAAVILCLAQLVFTSPADAQYTIGPSDPAEVEAFVDGLMAAQLDANHIAGATVSVVRNGEVVLTKGYGYADATADIEVDGDRTIFRIGSITKLFVWTAIMQLVEEGKLDLDTDVNEYLTDVEIPATYDEPITLAHLMTHTPGYEDHFIHLFGRDEQSLKPLSEILSEDMPERIRRPGFVASYSNHGVALAGYVVEQVTGMRWEEYIEQNILEPLGMEYTTARQPVPNALSEYTSEAHRWRNGEFETHHFEFVPPSPAGSISASAGDMTRFMIAHLHKGEYNGTRILEEETANRMHSTSFEPAPGVPGIAHGFIEANTNGYRTIGHSGGTVHFFSNCILIPEFDAGFFISTNSQQGGEVIGNFTEAFINRYFPPRNIEARTPPSGFNDRVANYVGSYRSIRYSDTTIAKLAVLMSGAVTVENLGESKIKLHAPGEYFEPGPWVEIEPGLFRLEDDHENLAFKEGEDGSVDYMVAGKIPVATFEKIQWYETPNVHVAIVSIAMLLLASAIVFYPAAAIIRRRYRVTLEAKQILPVFARITLCVIAVIYIAFFIGVSMSLQEPTDIVYGIPPMLEMTLYLPLIMAALAAVAAIFAIVIWIKGRGGITARLHYTAVVVAAAIALWQLNYLNLLGHHY